DGHCRAFTAGYTFTLTEHKRTDINGTYVLQWLSLSATQAQYANSFTAFPASVALRPPLVTRKPHMHGAQTALVVGKSGEEIWTDQYGRIKVQFHWDREGASNENSSCWVRVAQAWAGQGWGTLFIPRTLIGSRALAAYGDVDGPSAANNRPWSRKGTAKLLRRSDASASAHDYVGTHSVQRAGAGSVG